MFRRTFLGLLSGLPALLGLKRAKAAPAQQEEQGYVLVYGNPESWLLLNRLTFWRSQSAQLHFVFHFDTDATMVHRLQKWVKTSVISKNLRFTSDIRIVAPDEHIQTSLSGFIVDFRYDQLGNKAKGSISGTVLTSSTYHSPRTGRDIIRGVSSNIKRLQEDLASAPFRLDKQGDVEIAMKLRPRPAAN